MSRLINSLGAMTLLAALGGCAYDSPDHQIAVRSANRAAFTKGADLSDAHTDEIASESAAQGGDWRVSADLSERSYRQTPDLVNEFNLATTYQRTGRSALAIPLYIDLVERGQYTRTVRLLNEDGTWPKGDMKATLSEEASARLQRMGVGSKMLKPDSSSTASTDDHVAKTTP